MKKILGVVVVCLLLAIGPTARALDLVTNGAPAAVILLPKEPNPSEQAGAETLQSYLKKATGALLPTAKEPFEAGGNVISVGHTELAKAAGITEKGLVLDGFRLKTKGNIAFVFGRDVFIPVAPDAKGPAPTNIRGTYRAAFGFLQALGFKWAVPGEKASIIRQSKTADCRSRTT